MIDNRKNVNEQKMIHTLQLTALEDARNYWNIHFQHCNNAGQVFDDQETLVGNDDSKAEGLKHWAVKTLMAGDEHYNELYFLAHDPSMERLGSHDRYEPDVLGNNVIAEIKTTSITKNSDISKLALHAVEQLIRHRGQNLSKTMKVGLYLHNLKAYWPFDDKETLESADNASFQRHIQATNLNPYSGIKYRIWYSCLGQYRDF